MSEDGEIGSGTPTVQGNSQSRASDSTPRGSHDNTMGSNPGNPEQIAPIRPGLDPWIVATGMEKEVERFRNGEQSKENTLIRIIILCEKSSSPAAVKQQTAIQYIKLIDQIEKQTKRQIERGQGQSEEPRHGRTEPEHLDRTQHGGGRPSERRSPSPRSVDRETDHFIAAVKRSVAGEQSDDDGSNDESPAGKKRRIVESKLPWYENELAARASGRPETQKTRELLEYFSRNPTEVKQKINLAQSAPVGFPSTQWDSIINGRPVDLDVLLSSLNHVGAC
ncbi:hypothetical protein C0992_005101 [Termitomyces sp. T32_za158]|nr:hypothetical protein C0992_005101 [Termitomyces sp. T32_za158]